MFENTTKYFIGIGLIVALVLVGYLGYNIGKKDNKEAQFNPQVNITLSNGNQENSLTQIQIREIIGSSDSKTKQNFGKFYFVSKQIGSGVSTDILFKLDSIPIKITNTETKSEKEIPTELNIDLAIKTSEGLEFEYQNIGRIKLAFNEKKQLKGDFSSVINFELDQKNDKVVQRIVFRPTNTDQQNIYQDTDSNLPIKVRGDKSRGITGEPAPYFWVDI